MFASQRLLAISVLLAVVGAGAATPEPTEPERVNVRPSKGPPEKLQRDLIALLVSGAKDPKSRDEDYYLKESALIYGIGTQHTREAIRALVELLSFELGTASTEEVRCLVLKEGKRNRRAVAEELQRSENVCAKTRAQEGICKDPVTWAGHIDFLKQAVAGVEDCED